MFIDVHAHLTHEKFYQDLPDVISRAEEKGLGAIIVNGLDPQSNRSILDMAKKYPLVKPALGIYPVDAVCNMLPQDFPFPVTVFDVDQEIDFIRKKAEAKEIIAIGECGLDGYWLDSQTFAEQERVFIALIDVAITCQLPLIIHTRKLEQRACEILAHYKVKKVNFHCFGGRVSVAVRVAEEHGWYFSLPANINKNQAFQKMAERLPLEQILTETDCPYLSPESGIRNEPQNVVQTVTAIAKVRKLNCENVKNQLWENYLTLFGSQSVTL